MELHVVIDTKGCGRLVGVFDSRERAENVARLSRLYYLVHSIQLNRVNPDTQAWADNEWQQAALRKMVSRHP